DRRSPARATGSRTARGGAVQPGRRPRRLAPRRAGDPGVHDLHRRLACRCPRLPLSGERLPPPGPQGRGAGRLRLLPRTRRAPPAEPAPASENAVPKPPQVRSRKGFAIRITNPAHNDFRFGRSEIDAEVTAADPALVEKVEFFVDDRLVFIDTERPYQCFFD